MSNSKVSSAVHRALSRIALAAAAEDVDEDVTDKDGKAQAPPGAPSEDTVAEPDLPLNPRMDPEEVDQEPIDEDDEAFTLEDVIKCFLRANPNPTDEQVHAFAELMGLSYEEFEAEVFKKFGEVIRQAVSIGPSEDEEDAPIEGDETDLEDEELSDPEDDTELQVDDELDVQDDIDMFVVAYMLFNAQPTDEQIHQLAFVVDLTKEEMEQRIYRMLGKFLQMEGDAEDDDEDGEATDEDEGEEDGADDDEATDDPADDDDETDDPDAADEDAAEQDQGKDE